jgi:hypothetical protein
MRPFSVRAPNKSSGDRVRDLKAKNIFNGAKSSFRNNINRGNNYNNTIRFTKQGSLKSAQSNDLRQLLARGYALCEDGICDISNGTGVCDISNTNVFKRGLLNCSHGNMSTSVKIDTNTNIFSHFVQQLLPVYNGDQSLPMIGKLTTTPCSTTIEYGRITDLSCNSDSVVLSSTSSVVVEYDTPDKNDLIFDPSGLYMSSCGVGGCNVASGKKKHLWNSTTILGSQDISGTYQVCQGGSGINLSWGNNTKQNYLVSYDPKKKIRFNINSNVGNTKKCNVN